MTDAEAVAARFEEGRVLFSRATFQAQDRFASISNFRRTVNTTMPIARENHEQQQVAFILECLNDPTMAEIFLDREALSQPENCKKAAAAATKRAFESAAAFVDAASLVFAHAVFDATLFDYCRICAFRSPLSFVEILRDRKVQLADSQQLSRPAILWNSIQNYLTQIERESVLKKAQLLHRITQPDESFFRDGPIHFRYSAERLESIDRARHEAVHALQFTSKIADLDDTLLYLLRAVFYFVRILHKRWGLQLDMQLLPASTQAPR